MLKRLLIVLGILVALGSAYAWFYGGTAKRVVQTRYLAWKKPGLKLTPKLVKDLWKSRQTLSKVTYLGYEFEIPWTDVEEENTKRADDSINIEFRSGNSITVSVLQPRLLVNKVLTTADEEGIFPQILGEDVLQSDYTLTRKILDTTPDKINLFSQGTDAVTVAALISLKASEMPDADSGIFSYHVKDFQCFQFGNPDSKPRSFSVRMYSENRTIEIVVTEVPGAKVPPLSQADLETIVQSVRRVGTGSSGAGN